MTARKGFLAQQQNTFLDTIATKFDGTRKYYYDLKPSNQLVPRVYNLNQLNGEMVFKHLKIVMQASV